MPILYKINCEIFVMHNNERINVPLQTAKSQTSYSRVHSKAINLILRGKEVSEQKIIHNCMACILKFCYSTKNHPSISDLRYSPFFYFFFLNLILGKICLAFFLCPILPFGSFFVHFLG